MRIFKKFLRILAILLPSFLGVVFFSNNSYADSYSLTIESSNYPSSDIVFWKGSDTSISGDPILPFTPVYVEVSFTLPTYFYSYCGANGYGVLTTGQGTGYNYASLLCPAWPLSYSIDLSFVTSNSSYFLFFNRSQFLSMSSWLNFSFTYTFYDSLPGSSEPTPDPEPCPEIPENPYDTKLDDIKKAIYICGASAIMIYFFYIIYGIIIKPTGGTK